MIDLTKLLVITVWCLSGLGCQSFEVSITSEPVGATVHVREPETQTYKKLGITPYKLDGSGDQQLELFRENLMGIYITKDGFQSEHLLIDRAANPKVTLEFKLKPLPSLTSQAVAIATKASQQTAVSLREAELAIRRGELDRAGKLLDDLVVQYDQVPAIWEAKGSLAIIQGKFKAALVCYERSLKLRPESIPTLTAVNDLRRQLKLSGTIDD